MTRSSSFGTRPADRAAPARATVRRYRLARGRRDHLGVCPKPARQQAVRRPPTHARMVERFVGEGNPLGYITDTEESPPDADGWHTDITCLSRSKVRRYTRLVSAAYACR